MYILLFSSILLSLLFLMSNLFMTFMKNNYSFYNQLPFECGAMPFLMNYSFLSLKYLKMVLLFLIFDVEFALILPTSFLFMKNISNISIMSIFLLFNFILLSLIYEIGLDVLKWSY